MEEETDDNSVRKSTPFVDLMVSQRDPCGKAVFASLKFWDVSGDTYSSLKEGEALRLKDVQVKGTRQGGMLQIMMNNRSEFVTFAGQDEEVLKRSGYDKRTYLGVQEVRRLCVVCVCVGG